MQSPRLEHLPPVIPKQRRRRGFGIFTYLIIAAVLGSLLRLFPAYNIFTAADNTGILSSGDYSGSDTNVIGGVGSPYSTGFFGRFGNALIGSSISSSSSSYSTSPAYSPKDNLPEIYSTPLIKAASNGDVNEVAELLEDGEPVNGRDSENRTALIAAAYYGKNDVCALLLDNAAAISAKDKDGFTALDFAAARGLVDTVKLLLKKTNKLDAGSHTEYAMMMQAASSLTVQYMPKGKGIIASINRISPEDKSPLHVAASGGSVDLVSALLARGAKPNLTNRKGVTPLHMAAISNKTFVISLLLKKSAKINAADNDGNTPLMLAAEHNRKEAVILLLSKGANRKLRNKKGEDAVTIAGNKGFAEIITILQKQ